MAGLSNTTQLRATWVWIISPFLKAWTSLPWNNRLPSTRRLINHWPRPSMRVISKPEVRIWDARLITTSWLLKSRRREDRRAGPLPARIYLRYLDKIIMHGPGAVEATRTPTVLDLEAALMALTITCVSLLVRNSAASQMTLVSCFMNQRDLNKDLHRNSRRYTVLTRVYLFHLTSRVVRAIHPR